MKKALFAVKKEWFEKIFSRKDIRRIDSLCEVINKDIPAEADKKFLMRNCGPAEIIISSWDTANLDSDVISVAANLQFLPHAAGSIKSVVSEAFWQKGARSTSAAAAIAYGVAEFCLAQILTASKRVFWAAQGTRQGHWKEGIGVFNGPHEIYQQKVGVIGAGHVGRHLIRLLGSFSCEILLYDPYITVEQAGELGATKAETLDEIFSQCIAVSLNAPSTDGTRRMIHGRHFAMLPDGATFVNTAKCAIVNEEEFLLELRKGRFVACIDVTDPVEPAPADHPFRSLPNVLLTPHIAGVTAENMLRIGTFVADEIEAFVGNRPLHCEVTQAQLATIA